MVIKNILVDWKRRLQYQVYKKLSSLIEFGANQERYENAAKAAVLHPSVKLLPNANFVNLNRNPSLISVGEKTVILGQLIVLPHKGKIEIGEECYIGIDTRIWSSEFVKIGDRVVISHDVNIHDTDSHSVNPSMRHAHLSTIMLSGHPNGDNFDIKSKPIYIEDDVWIGFNSTILKGVKIGRGSVIAACSVVTKDVPELTVVAGNPAKVIKQVEHFNELSVSKN